MPPDIDLSDAEALIAKADGPDPVIDRLVFCLIAPGAADRILSKRDDGGYHFPDASLPKYSADVDLPKQQIFLHLDAPCVIQQIESGQFVSALPDGRFKSIGRTAALAACGTLCKGLTSDGVRTLDAPRGGAPGRLPT